jgi:hypothetical protein
MGIGLANKLHTGETNPGLLKQIAEKCADWYPFHPDFYIVFSVGFFRKGQLPCFCL